jgi:hypothetical protein
LDRPTASWPAVRPSSLVKRLAFCLFSAPLTPLPLIPALLLYLRLRCLLPHPVLLDQLQRPRVESPEATRMSGESSFWPSTRARPGCPLGLLTQNIGQARVGTVPLPDTTPLPFFRGAGRRDGFSPSPRAPSLWPVALPAYVRTWLKIRRGVRRSRFVAGQPREGHPSPEPRPGTDTADAHMVAMGAQ